MKIIFAEALKQEFIKNEKGKELIHGKVLEESSHKYITINKLFQDIRIKYFLTLGVYLNSYLNSETPLVFITDWTDPTEIIGVRLEDCNGVTDYPELSCLAFYTNWDNIESSGIEEIFAHEFSHLWLHRLGLDMRSSKSNKFHTCSAITDPFMAFSEGFAEHLEIVASELMGNLCEEIWDDGYDVNSWLCLRDSKMRIHGVKNNRFIYCTAYPYEEDFKYYNHLHMAHITSSAFTPEKIKNGSQMMCSEGVIASIFYRIYKSEVFKSNYVEESFYEKFKAIKDIEPITNLYLKILYTLTKMDLNAPNPMINFIVEYGSLFPSEREELIKLFLAVTHFATAYHEAPSVFGNLYRIGRQGEMENFKAYLLEVRRKKEQWLLEVLSKEVPLDFAIYKELWIETDSKITPVPWNKQHLVKYKIDINTATEIDFMAIEGITLEQAKDIVKRRESIKGFSNTNEEYFY